MKTLLATLSVALIPTVLPAQEICNNGIDDDGDGLIDLNDPDCPCSTLLSTTPSFIPNPSFEDRWCCPLWYNLPPGPPYFNCAIYWQQATIPTSDYFHSCGNYPDFFPLPPPDGEGFVGMRMVENWQEYVGACLMYPGPPSPLLAGVEYTLSFHVAGTSLRTGSSGHGTAGPFYSPTPIPLALYGAPLCVPFPVNTLGCPVPNGWTLLASMDYQANGDWDHLSFTFTPSVEIQTVMFGTGCTLPAGFFNVDEETAGYAPYLLLDNLHLTAAIDQVMLPVMSTGHVCADNVVVIGQPPVGMTDLQWYLNGVALPGQTSTTLNVSALGLGGGTYTLAGTYDEGCLMGSTFVMEPAPPRALVLIDPVVGCAPLTVAFADTSTVGTTTELWDLGDGTTRSDSAFTHTYTVPGTYDVRLQVRNGPGCVGDTLIPDAITVLPGIQANISVQPNPTFAEDPTVNLTGSGNGNIITWWWDLGAGEPGTSDQASVAATFPAVPGEYPVMLVVTTAEGCIDTIHSFVRVIDPGVIEMPNVFTPNGDGQNDRFIPIGYKGVPGFMEIYNRWGQVIFSTRNLAQGWNGGDAPDGTYFYIVTPDGTDTPSLAGHVTLVR
ncbi:MAG TPA: PKD domain-containing protein [Flavobacteriales bacterium]|nr:PKD domain-containing protein [Flavobacteriales bacterium]